MARRGVISVITILFTFVLTGAALAAIPNNFVSTNEDTNIVDLNILGDGLQTGWAFGVYDFGASPDSGIDLLSGCAKYPCLQSASFEVTQDGRDNLLTVTAGPSTGQSLNIGSSPNFSFYFKYPDNNSYSYETDFNIFPVGGGIYYFISNEGGGGLTGVDLAPVPIPGTSALLLSGLVGLVALGSRKGNKGQ